MKTAGMIAAAIVGGIVITLLTGLAQSTPVGLVGASWYGYPAGWLIRLVIAPQYFPWKANYLNLLVDIVFWAIIIGIILTVIRLLKGPKKKH